MNLLNTGLNRGGIYRAQLFTENGETYAYIPGLSKLNTDEATVKNLSKIQWCAYNIESTLMENIKNPCWIMFENGDVRRPVCISYAIIGGGNLSEDVSSDENYKNYSTIIADGFININGLLNDDRNSKYLKSTNIYEIPQAITYEFGKSYFESYLNTSAVKNTSWFKNIKSNVQWNNKNIGGKSYELACAGEAVLVATTKKFGTVGDYMMVHFTNGTYLPCIKFDEKDENGQEPHANEWGHWESISNSNRISILEIAGKNSGTFNIYNVTIDYIVNLGINIANDTKTCKSYEKMLDVVNKKIDASKTNGNNIVNTAKKYLGVKYEWGGTTPKAFDCSGFTYYVYKECGINISRTSELQYASGNFVNKNDLQAGDLVFFKGSDGSSINPGHVGIYIGNNEYIHSPRTGDVVKISVLSDRLDYVGAKRYK